MTGEFPAQRASTGKLFLFDDVIMFLSILRRHRLTKGSNAKRRLFVVSPNKLLIKQSAWRWFETPRRSNDVDVMIIRSSQCHCKTAAKYKTDPIPGILAEMYRVHILHLWFNFTPNVNGMEETYTICIKFVSTVYSGVSPGKGWIYGHLWNVFYSRMLAFVWRTLSSVIVQRNCSE